MPATLPRIVVHNKIDLAGVAPKVELQDDDGVERRHVLLSAKTGAGIDLLRHEILALAGAHEDMEGTFLARERHLVALRDADTASRRGRAHLNAAPAAAGTLRRGTAWRASRARRDHRRIHRGRSPRRDLFAVLHRQVTVSRYTQWKRGGAGRALGAVAGWVCSRLHTPIPWMLGPLVTIAFLRVAGVRVGSPPGGRQVGQWIIGTSLGLYFTPLVVREVAGWWWLLAAGAVFAIGLGYGGVWRRWR